jgi:putative restriction endonuclease
MSSREYEERVRSACFIAIGEMQRIHGDVLPVDVISRGVVVDGERIALFSLQKGIHKPRQLDAALAVTTAPPRLGKNAPYADHMDDEGLYAYHYRSARTKTPQAREAARRDNEAVHIAMQRGLEIIYWHGVVPGQYLPFFPVRVLRDDPVARVFRLELTGLAATTLRDIASEAPARRYRSVVALARMHQARFRSMVLRAYAGACSVCRLRRAELVDAAHIVTDAQGGEPVVPNGLALCRLHHAAFDRNIMGVSPNLVIHVRQDVLREVDGPMLIHGLQGFHGATLAVVPRRIADRPGVAFLARRWEEFRAAS